MEILLLFSCFLAVIEEACVAENVRLALLYTEGYENACENRIFM